MKIKNNGIGVKSYLFLIVFFILIAIFFIRSIIIFNIPLIIIFTFSALVLGILVVLFEPKKTIRFKYGDNILFDIGKE